MRYICEQSALFGRAQITPSKSHSMRAILLASMANGTSVIDNYLCSPDIFAMIKACSNLGADIRLVGERQLVVHGISGCIRANGNIIDAGNSGQILRFLTAMSALSDRYTVVTGDYSIRHNRPMLSLISGLRQLGAFCISTKNNSFAPIIVRGPVAPGEITIDGQDSQPVSALLMAAAFMPGTTTITVTNSGEKPWVDLTLSWLERLGVSYVRKKYEQYIINGCSLYQPFNFSIPSDLSSAIFPVVAALITKSEITIDNIDMSDEQGDKKAIFALQDMGANIVYEESNQKLRVKRSTFLRGQKINVNDFIDAVPILAVMGCFASGVTVLTGASAARGKECDRLRMMTSELLKMGAKIEEVDDGLKICNSKLHGAKVVSHADHRVAMSLAIAGIGSTGITEIDDIGCVAKSFPTFCKVMQGLGVNIKVVA